MAKYTFAGCRVAPAATSTVDEIDRAIRDHLIRYDRHEEEKAAGNPRRHHNPYAMGHYLKAADRIRNNIADGMTAKEAIMAVTTPSTLRTAALKAIGEKADHTETPFNLNDHR